MMGTKKYLCWVIVALMFLAVMSVGCGGGNSGSISTNNNSSNDITAPDNGTEQEQENSTPENPSNSTDDNENRNENNNNNTGISGTWKFVSGDIYSVSTIQEQDNYSGTYDKSTEWVFNVTISLEEQSDGKYTIKISGNDVMSENSEWPQGIAYGGFISSDNKDLGDHAIIRGGEGFAVDEDGAYTATKNIYTTSFALKDNSTLLCTMIDEFSLNSSMKTTTTTHMTLTRN